MTQHPLLSRMLDRLYASMVNGPSLNCRPSQSRQRLDLTALALVGVEDPAAVLAAILGEQGLAKVQVRLPDAGSIDPSEAPTERTELGAAGKPRRRARTQVEELQALLRKLATIAEDARIFEQDTGARVLHLGYPLLHVPPRPTDTSVRRILAPVAFIPVELVVKKGRVQLLELSSAADGADKVMPNSALLAWVEQQTGKRLRTAAEELEAEDPWRELNGLVEAICDALELPRPAPFAPGSPLRPTPRADEAPAGAAILPSAVLGLYPASNQSLLEDLKALADGEPLRGPLEAFLRVDARLQAAEAKPDDAAAPEPLLVSHADPCQSRAVGLARTSQGLVIHGPPGTGKSQTIANVIGDHLARGERVLLVCDKRTALDVVKYRLDALGLGGLCAVVHDPERDPRELYRSIREQLEGLTDAPVPPDRSEELARVDAERAMLRARLRRQHDAVSASPGPGAASFHELVGSWFGLAPGDVRLEVRPLRLGEVTAREQEVREVLERAATERYPNNPWRDAIGCELETWIAAPLSEHRRRLEQVVVSARALDATASADIPAFDPELELAPQQQARARLARALEAAGDPERITRWTAPERAAERRQVEALAPQLDALERSPPDPELSAVQRGAPMALGTTLTWIAHLTAYLAIARRWFGFLFFGRRRRARTVVQQFGLPLRADAAERVRGFLDGVRARTLLEETHTRVLEPGAPPPSSEAALRETFRAHLEAIAVATALEDHALGRAETILRRALRTAEGQRRISDGLSRSAARAEALRDFEASLRTAGVLDGGWVRRIAAEVRGGASVSALVAELLARLSTVEGLLRLRLRLGALPQPLADAVRTLAAAGASPQDGWSALHHAALEAELGHRVRATPALQEIDPDALRAAHERLAALNAHRRELVRAVILHRWAVTQRTHLLAGTASRLGAEGAELKRRLTARGRRAARLRQVIAQGRKDDRTDPLFDLRPVWMASPQTVAQIFPREAVFDLVVFDESSQCRLEEALPVLTRARRVVIAGDPKQLPPSRFFESAVQQSADEDVDGDQELFEAQQGEVEDLLAASLNLEIDQAYLDVHYRSQNAELIEFSNRAFYEARLQAIPGHPSRRAAHAPVRLVRVPGVYEKRANRVEAEEVVRIVRELLERPRPPSIGIACFNLAQRDVIQEVLEDAAAADPAFATKLATARKRRGGGSFEGLFVKNLENVQGDERDHLIISTTYGPDSQGKFFRRFGPLAMAGGGRRLNVLVTRAREEVHLVTSIPRDVYRSLPPVEAGQAPNGAWLLFSYLQYAEELSQAYEPGAALAAAPGEHGARVAIRKSAQGSPFAIALAHHLARAHGLSSEVHRGNDGFCVDVALEHPGRPGDVALGLLCDGARFAKGVDPVDWDVFRTGILQDQGWSLMRLWSPHFFRDPDGALAAITRAVATEVAAHPAEAPKPAKVKEEVAPWEDTRAIERRLLN